MANAPSHAALTIKSGPGAGRVIELTEGELVIGRVDPAGLVMSDRIAAIPRPSCCDVFALTKRPRAFTAACHRSSTPVASGAQELGVGVGQSRVPAAICDSTVPGA